MAIGDTAQRQMSLEVQVAVAADWHTIRLAGDLDVASKGLLDDAVAGVAASARRITLDLTSLRFMDSTGVRAIVDLNERCARDGVEVRIIRGPKAVQRVFELLGLLDVLPFQDKLTEA